MIGASAGPYYARLRLGRLRIHWIFPWGWVYNWRSYLWEYTPDDGTWFVRVVGVEISWVRRE